VILQALYDLAQREQLVPDPDYEVKPVAWLVQVGKGGQLGGLLGTHSVPTATGKRKPKPLPKSFSVPRHAVRTVGDRAHFLVDKAEYVFGIDPSGTREAKKLAARARLFAEQVEACAAATKDEGALAVVQLLAGIASGSEKVSLPKDLVSNDLIGFVYIPDGDRLVSSRPRVRDFWRSQRQLARPSGQSPRCLVTGEPSQPDVLHVQLKRLPGASTSGVPLVSFNQRAFESYGWKGNENAPVSRNAAEAYGTALNRLLHPAYPDPRQPESTLPRRNVRLGGNTVVCYWASRPAADDFLSSLNGLLEANPDSVATVYRSIWRGRPASDVDPAAFYALTLSGTQGRAIVRDWFESTVDRVQQNLAQHFADLDIVHNVPKPKTSELPPTLSLNTLLTSLSVRGDSERVPPDLAAPLVRAALAATAYPLGLLLRATERMRAEISRREWVDLYRRDARAAIVKAVLNRRRRLLPDAAIRYREVTPEMDPTNANPGYLLGRIMALLERIQERALGDINATVTDRYFAGASAAPRSAFVRLVKGARHHLRKLRDDNGAAYVFYSRLLDELHSYFRPEAGGYPPHLSLEDQGLFLLGYHHMRHWLWMTKEQREAWRERQSAVTAESSIEPRREL
jgi:CRISPR-associated protein Csd1